MRSISPRKCYQGKIVTSLTVPYHTAEQEQLYFHFMPAINKFQIMHNTNKTALSRDIKISKLGFRTAVRKFLSSDLQVPSFILETAHVHSGM